MNYSALTWVVQSNNIDQDVSRAVLDVATTLGCQTSQVGLVPFSHEPTGEVHEPDGLCVVYGSSGLLDFAKRSNWKPAGWAGSRFDVKSWLEPLGLYALNNDGAFAPFSRLAEESSKHGWDEVFVRPSMETKEFPGKFFRQTELREWIAKLESSGYLDRGDNLAFIAPEKQLGREWRGFWIGNELVSVSQYAMGGIPQGGSSVPEYVNAFMEKMANIYSPAPCFVIDIAEIRDGGETGLRVVEFNSINSSGFYDCDIERIVGRISSHVLRHNNEEAS